MAMTFVVGVDVALRAGVWAEAVRVTTVGVGVPEAVRVTAPTDAEIERTAGCERRLMVGATIVMVARIAPGVGVDPALRTTASIRTPNAPVREMVDGVARAEDVIPAGA